MILRIQVTHDFPEVQNEQLQFSLVYHTYIEVRQTVVGAYGIL